MKMFQVFIMPVLAMIFFTGCSDEGDAVNEIKDVVGVMQIQVCGKILQNGVALADRDASFNSVILDRRDNSKINEAANVHLPQLGSQFNDGVICVPVPLTSGYDGNQEDFVPVSLTATVGGKTAPAVSISKDPGMGTLVYNVTFSLDSLQDGGKVALATFLLRGGFRNIRPKVDTDIGVGKALGNSYRQLIRELPKRVSAI